MAIFPLLELEEVVQVDDRTRLDGTKSLISKGDNPVTLVRIKPEATESFINVTGNKTADWYLDWVYATSGTKTITIEITTDTTPTSAPVTVSKDFTIEAVTAATDLLFSTDKDIMEFEHDVLKYVPAGKSSFNYVHRKAQELIVDWVNSRGNIQSDLSKFDKSDFLDVSEVKEWSTALTLQLIFEARSNAVDDIFDKKAKYYASMAMDKRTRAVLRLDLDGDDVLDQGEYLGLTSARMLRR